MRPGLALLLLGRVAAAETPGATSPCTRHVEPGARLREPVAGDVVCFADGTHRPIRLSGVAGTAEAPIVLRAAPGAVATVTNGALDRGTAITLDDVAHLRLQGLRVHRARVGVDCTGCRDVRIEGMRIETLGRLGIHVGQRRDGDRFVGPPSARVDVVGNTIRDTGHEVARYGEGVYVGTGGAEGDETHHVRVLDNHISDTRAEGIDIKPWTHHVLVRGNEVVGGSHFFHGAISVGVQAFAAPDGHHRVEGNRVHGFRSTGEAVGGIVVGHGSTEVVDNVVWGIDGGPGIRLTTTFASAAARAVRLSGNAVWTPGHPGIALCEGDERTGLTDACADATLDGNRTHDGAAGSARIGAGDFGAVIPPPPPEAP